MTLLERALSQYGIKEISGEQHNPEILKYFSVMNDDWVQSDETAWCSAFINWCCIKAGKKSSGALNARSWLKVGTKTTNPQVGDIVVFWREDPKSWKGHVGLFIRDDGEYIWTLGGNQRNRVEISPYEKERVLQYRRV